MKNRIHGRFLNRMPVKEADVVQIAPGRMNFRTMEIWGRETFILKIASEAYASFTARPHSGWIGFLVPVTWTDAFRVNGYLHEPDRAYYLDGTHDYTVACQESVRILVGVRRNLMNAAIAEISGDIDVYFLSGSRVFANCKDCISKMKDLIAWLQTESNKAPDSFEGMTLSREQEKAVVQQIATWLLEKMDKPTPAWLGQNDDYHIATKIRDAVKDRPPHETLTLDDLYRIADVGKNRLHQCFTNVYGAPPVRYLSMRQLWRARQFLLDPKNANCKIRDVETRFGYPSSGRFAEKYRTAFDELPSDTIRFARNLSQQ